MNTLKTFEQTVYLFKEINPAKRFSQFSYTELQWNEVNGGYCNKDEILKIDNKYFLFADEIKNYCQQQQPTLIRFQNGKKIVKQIFP